MEVDKQQHARAVFALGKGPRTHYTGSCLGPKAGLEVHGVVKPLPINDLRAQAFQPA
jgi:hypothetical protein